MIKTEKGSVNVNNVVTEYAKFGTGKKHFIIIPGINLRNILDSADSIASAYSMFAEDYTVWVFDRRVDMPEGYTVEDMAEDIAAAIKSAGIADAYFFGTSQGGMIVQFIAARYPELVRKAVLGSTAARLTDEVKARIEQWSELARNNDLDTLCAEFADSVYSQSFLAKYRRLLIEYGKLATPAEIVRFRIMSEACRGFDVYDELDKITCPIFVIGTNDDRVLGGTASVDIAEKLGCRLYMYDEYGHAVYDEASDYKQRIMDFFNEAQ